MDVLHAGSWEKVIQCQIKSNANSRGTYVAIILFHAFEELVGLVVSKGLAYHLSR